MKPPSYGCGGGSQCDKRDSWNEENERIMKEAEPWNERVVYFIERAPVGTLTAASLCASMEALLRTHINCDQIT